MTPYRAIISARFRMLLQYRIAALAGVWTQVFFGCVLIMIYEAFYRSSTADVQPMAFAQVATYVWLGQALLAMLPWNTDSEIAAMIRSGSVVYELCRPIDLYALWYARAVAQRTAPTILRAVPLTIVAGLVLPAIGFPEWRLAPPASPEAALGFVAALACSLALGCAITTLLHISLMWTIGGTGIVLLVSTLVLLLSGMLIPLPLFPDAVRAVIEWLPFAGLADLPFRVYAGHVTGGEIALVLARQLGWTIALIALGRILIARGVRVLTVQGG
jgi:ABC-2 type transport system permease protein